MIDLSLGIIVVAVTVKTSLVHVIGRLRLSNYIDHGTVSINKYRSLFLIPTILY